MTSRPCWRNLAQTVEHDAAHGHVRARAGPGDRLLRGHQRPAACSSILNDDVNQLERFLDIGRQRRSSALFWNLVILVGDRLPDRRRLAARRWSPSLPIPVIVLGLAPLPAPPRARSTRGVREQVGRALRARSRQPRRHRDDQGLHAPRSARPSGSTDESQAYLRGQQRGHPPLLGLRPAHPHGDPGRLHGHAAASAAGW